MAKDLSVFTDESVDVIFERAHSQCERCGIGINRNYGRGEWWSIHHRESRGFGGAKKSWWLALPSNGVLLCGSGTTRCHSWVEHNPADSKSEGWLVNRHGVRRAAEIPLLHVLYGWCRLTEEGGYEKCDPDD